LLLKVTRRLRGRDGSSVPRLLVPVVPLDLQTSVKTRDLVLSELDSADPFGNPIMGLINAPWDSTVTEDPRAGSVEIWHLINTQKTRTPSISTSSSSRSSIHLRDTRSAAPRLRACRQRRGHPTCRHIAQWLDRVKPDDFRPCDGQ